jgi:hypothetical protein
VVFHTRRLKNTRWNVIVFLFEKGGFLDPPFSLAIVLSIIVYRKGVNMKRAALMLAIMLIIVMTVNCGTVIVAAPPGKDIELLSENETGRVVTMKKCWYLLWGLVPISNNSTAPVVAEYQLKSVRVTSYYSPIDFIISFFLGFTTLHTRTVEIEGNVSQ